MAKLDKAALSEQLEAAADAIISLPRHDRGYQGLITVEDVIVVVVVRGEDGRRYYVDPAEISDRNPDCFVREYVRVGERGGVNVLDLLDRFLPLVSPKAAGLLGWLRRLGK